MHTEAEFPGPGRVRPAVRPPAGLWGLVLALAALLLAPAGAQGTQERAGESYTPVVQSVPFPPRWFQGADGRVHLVYELMLTNAFPVPVTVTSVEVLAADEEASLVTLGGAQVRAAMSLLASGARPTTRLPASSVGVLWLDLPFADAGHLPAAVRHRVTVRVPEGLSVPGLIADVGGAAVVDGQPPTVLGPPLAGAGWAAIGSCCDGPHRRALQPVGGRLWLSQRFAIDFNRLDPASRIVVGDPDLNRSYPTFAQPVLAVADARVVRAVDRFADQTPNHPDPVTIEDAEGNHIVLDLGGGRFALYAHLRAGSVTVRPGQRVARGAVIAEVGNSGSSSGPHLHFHLMDGPSPLAADGLPYVFDRYVLSGRLPPLAALLAADPLAPLPVNAASAGPQHDTLPLGRDLVSFPEVAGSGRP